MSIVFGDVNVRARGIQGRLFTATELRDLATARKREAVEAALLRHGYPATADRLAAPADLEDLVGAVATDRLNLLAHWLGPRQAALRMVLEPRELMALRALIRGLAAGASSSARLHGVHPSVLWPASLLTRLAAATSLAAMHRVLRRARHPAAALFGSRVEGVDLLHLEISLSHWWAGRVLSGARGAGAAVGRLAQGAIDQQNLRTLLLAGGWGVEVDPGAVFLPGGRVLSRSSFLALAREPDGETQRMALAAQFRGTPTGRILGDAGIPAAAIARRLRAAAITSATRNGRTAPLGPAPTVEVILRIEAEAEDLRRVIHGLALEAPPAVAATGVLVAA